MKKTYIAPELLVTYIQTGKSFLGMSDATSNNDTFDIGGVKEGSADIEFTREDKGWDIWGDDYNE